MKKRLLLYLMLAGAVLASLVPAQTASAVTGSDWRAGRIIDDAIFYNKTTMSVQQIQDFLNSKVACDRWGTEPSEYGGGTRAQYGASRGYPAPYTCLPDYHENTTTKENNLEGRSTPPGAKSAAQIIWDTAQTYGINPQVLIVLLQKEQALVTDEWPFPIQYRSATGYGCPDTAACDSTYYGLFNQVDNAAKQFIRYRTSPTSYNHWPSTNNNVRWSPNAACGSSTVFIENQATAGLYNYTPYQPNQAALNNLYGTGDGCSAYGNRNFWRLFNDWFGTTTGKRFAAQFVAQNPYPVMKAGGVATFSVRLRNIGGSSWQDTTSVTPGRPPITLAATNPINRRSHFSQAWYSLNRPAGQFAAVYEQNNTTLADNQSVVEPGQVAKFTFTLSAPIDLKQGIYREWFQPVAEGVPDWDMGGIIYIDITVQPADYSAQFYRMSPYPTITRSYEKKVYIDYKNTGTKAWYDDTSLASAPTGEKPIHLANTSPINRVSDLRGSDWHNSNRPDVNFDAVYLADGKTLATNQHIVQPGEIGRFSYSYSPPVTKSAGKYREWIQPIQEGASNWTLGAFGYFDVTVTAPEFGLKFNRFSGYPTIAHGGSTTVWIDYQNIGTKSHYDRTVSGTNPTNLGNILPTNRSSQFKDSTWINNSRPATQFQAVYEADGSTLAADQKRVHPGQIVRYQYKYFAPTTLTPGVYREWIQPIREMSSNWGVGTPGFFDITVTP